MLKIITSAYFFVQKVLCKCKIMIAKKLFIKACVTGKNFSCGPSSKCINKTGKKENIKIGNNCEIMAQLVAEGDASIVIGSHTTIRNHTRLFAVDKIEIGDYVIVSNNVIIYDNNNHPTSPERRMAMSKCGFYGDLWHAKHSEHSPISIRDNVWIGERAVILKGVNVGKGAIVAMGAVVTKDVPDYAVVAGNPARIVKYVQ